MQQNIVIEDLEPGITMTRVEPEALRHWEAVHREHGTICEFFDWMEASGLSFEVSPVTALAKALFPKLDDMKPLKLADAFLGVDRKALEAARRSLLKQIACERLTEMRITMPTREEPRTKNQEPSPPQP